MSNFLKRDAQGYYIDKALLKIEGTKVRGVPVNTLEQLQNMCNTLKKEQGEISVELEALRGKNKEKSARFRELLGKKVMNSNMLGMLRLYELTD